MTNSGQALVLRVYLWSHDGDDDEGEEGKGKGGMVIMKEENRVIVEVTKLLC